MAVDRVKDRLLRAARALDAAGVLYAVAGGNAVAAWVASVDPAAVRNTQDVDILLRRSDLEQATQALERVGFIRRHVAGIEMFLDSADASARDALHIIFAAEKVNPEYAWASPDVIDSQANPSLRLLSLESPVAMKLTSYQWKDQVHLLDMLEIGLIDASWKSRFSPELAGRLQHLIDTPDA